MSSNPNGYNMFFKIVLIGDSSVGKTKVLSKYLSNDFEQFLRPTIGVDFGLREFKIDNNMLNFKSRMHQDKRDIEQ